MGEAYVIVSDLGTGGCKTLAVDAAGRVAASAQAEYTTHYPHPGWAEQNPQDWVEAVGRTVRDVLAQLDDRAAHIAGYGLVGVTHNAVLLDEHDQPLRPCILLYDIRSEPESLELSERWGDRIFARAWNSISPLWTWPQLLWIKRHEPNVWASNRKVLFQKDYVRHCLAPSLVTDVIDVEGTLLYDPVADEWIDEFIEELELPYSALPDVVQPTDIVSHIDEKGSAITGLPLGTPVIAGTTDTVAETFGCGAMREGQGMVKLASVGRIACVSSRPGNHPNLLNYRHVIDDLWYPGVASKYATTSYRWLRESIWDNASYKAMSTAAAAVPPGCDGLIFHPHLQGEWVPFWDTHLRGDFMGLTLRHGRPHFTRAVMEGVAFALRAGVEYAMSVGLPFEDVRLVGQGGTSGLWAQIIADTLNRTIMIPVERDAAYGGALIVGMGVGVFSDQACDIEKIIQIKRTLDPDQYRAERYDELFKIYQDADKALKAISHRLTAFEQKHAN